MTHPGNTYPIGECTWEPKNWPLGPTTGGEMAACGQLAHALRDSGQGRHSRGRCHACWDNGDMGHVALVTDVEHDQKFRSKRLTTTAIAISTTSVVGSIQPTPSGEPSPTSTQIKVFITSRKGVGKNSDYLRLKRFPQTFSIFPPGTASTGLGDC